MNNKKETEQYLDILPIVPYSYIGVMVVMVIERIAQHKLRSCIRNYPCWKYSFNNISFFYSRIYSLESQYSLKRRNYQYIDRNRESDAQRNMHTVTKQSTSEFPTVVSIKAAPIASPTTQFSKLSCRKCEDESNILRNGSSSERKPSELLWFR